MKYIVLTLLLCGFSIKSYTQNNSILNKPVTLNAQQLSLDNVLRLITEQTGVVFSYNPQAVNTSRKVSIQVTNKPLTLVLNQLLGSSITYKEKGRYIILTQLAETNVSKVAPLAPLATPIAITPDTILLNNQGENRNTTLIFKKITRPDSGNFTLACHSCINSKNNEMMKKYIATIMLTAGLGAATQVNAQSQPDSVHSRPGQVSFIYPLGTDGVKSAENTYKFSLNVLGGNTGGVSGVELGGLFNMNNYTTNGAQFAGLFNKSNKVGGAQFAGIFNMAETSETAIQFAGIANMAKTGNVILQGSGIANIADTATVQVSGVINIAKKSKVQIGIINISDTANIMIGLLNIAKNGFMEFEVAGGELLHTTMSFRSGTKAFYGIVAVGGNFSKNSFFAYGAGIGTTFDMSQSWGLNLEGVVYTLTTRKFEHSKFYNGLIQVRPVVYHQVSKHLKFFAGPVANLSITDVTEDRLNINAPYTIWNTTSGNKRLEAWIGFTAGVRF